MESQRFSQFVSIFQERALPERTMLMVGYAALINHYHLSVPLPSRLAVISSKHTRYENENWTVFTPKYAPADTLAGHLVFALKYEGVDLAVLNALFAVVPTDEIRALVQKEPTGRYTRRIWFFNEWLTGNLLDLPDVSKGDYTDAIDETLQYPGPATSSKRHRVRNNLPGVIDFCPLIRRTKKLERLMASDLSKQAASLLGKVHPDITARAAAFLLLKDSKASYAIEGERPPHGRPERWGRILGDAGQQKLTMDEFIRLQQAVIESSRFLRMGWREEGGFVGVHDRTGQTAIPDHISARWQDLPRLMKGLIATDEKLAASAYDPVLSAALIAFGFVFIHPFADGNGRIHRFLIHHVLAEKGFAPKGIVFPVSAVILNRIEEYRQILEAHSKVRLNFMEWEPTERGNVSVLNETLDLYRFFDATVQAEFLYDCVRQTILETLPEEVDYLVRHDRMKSWLERHFDMPTSTVELLIAFLRQGEGKLSNRALEKEFSALTDQEAAELEGAYKEIFG